MNDYFSGLKLYGNDFSIELIKKWYEEETEGYSELGSKNIEEYFYGYHEINKIHGFEKISDNAFNNVLGFGSAWGHEFEPILNKTINITIIEPSDTMRSEKIGDITPIYVKPSIDGRLAFDDDLFDLITCFGTLHHIPNVSFVLSEIFRILKPNGVLLLREPIVTMGDWRKSRKGLTKNERGIPVSFFDKEFNKYPIEILSKEYCFTVTSILQRTIGVLFRKPIYSYKLYVLFDKYISNFLKTNVHYHSTKKINKIAPGSIFYVIRKISN